MILAATLTWNSDHGELVAEVISRGKMYALHYSAEVVPPNYTPIMCAKNVVKYKIGLRNATRTTVTRNLEVDLWKGLELCTHSHEGSSSHFKVPHLNPPPVALTRVLLRGSGQLERLSLQASAHEAAVMGVANWLVKNIDDKGGWPNTIERVISPARSPSSAKHSWTDKPFALLKPGWKSAMAQGQAMSLLVRAYYFTRDEVSLRGYFGQCCVVCGANVLSKYVVVPKKYFGESFLGQGGRRSRQQVMAGKGFTAGKRRELMREGH